MAPSYSTAYEDYLKDPLKFAEDTKHIRKDIWSSPFLGTSSDGTSSTWGTSTIIPAYTMQTTVSDTEYAIQDFDLSTGTDATSTITYSYDYETMEHRVEALRATDEEFRRIQDRNLRMVARAFEIPEYTLQGDYSFRIIDEPRDPVVVRPKKPEPATAFGLPLEDLPYGVAEERGMEMLKTVVGDPAFESFQKTGFVDVPSQIHRDLRLRIRAYRRVALVRRDNRGNWVERPDKSLCIHPRSHHVKGDEVATMVLLAQHDEQQIWDKANVWREAA